MVGLGDKIGFGVKVLRQGEGRGREVKRGGNRRTIQGGGRGSGEDVEMLFDSFQ